MRGRRAASPALLPILVLFCRGRHSDELRVFVDRETAGACRHPGTQGRAIRGICLSVAAVAVAQRHTHKLGVLPNAEAARFPRRLQQLRRRHRGVDRRNSGALAGRWRAEAVDAGRLGGEHAERLRGTRSGGERCAAAKHLVHGLKGCAGGDGDCGFVAAGGAAGGGRQAAMLARQRSLQGRTADSVPH